MFKGIMNHLIPDKVKIRIMFLIIIVIYFAISINNYVTIQQNLSVEEYIMPLGGNIEVNGKELNRLYAQVSEDTLALPEAQRNNIKNITLKYSVIFWAIMALFSYLASCLIIFRIENEKT